MINVIIPYYNHACYLPDAINGIVAQQGSGECRILLFNDDPGVNLNPYEYQHGVQVEVFGDGGNLGQSIRFNAGIDISTRTPFQSDWVCFHGADDISLPHRFGIFNTYLANIMAGVWPDIVYSDAISLDMKQYRSYIQSHPMRIDILKSRNFIVASTVFVRTQFLKEHPEVRFDGGIPYGEDWLFYNKAARAGAIFNYLPIPLVMYRDYTSQIHVRYEAGWAEKKAELLQMIEEIWQEEPKAPTGQSRRF